MNDLAKKDQVFDNFCAMKGLAMEFDLNEVIPVFETVGELKTLLKDYPNDMPLHICGVPGLFCWNKLEDCVLLEVQDSSGWETIECLLDGYLEAEYMEQQNMGVEYMDF